MNAEYDKESIRQQAEAWFARLRAEDCSTAECRDFDGWLAADAEHAAAYAKVERLWNDLEGLAGDIDIQRARRSVRISARHHGRRLLLIAASLAALMAAGLLALLFGIFTPGQRYATGHGEQRSVVLADGSRLILNTDTELEVLTQPNLRSVRLIKGEALFEIVHDPRRPFVVKSGGNTIVDLGTRFDVRQDDGPVMVTVLQGEVSVERGDRSLQLGPGEQVTAGRGVWRRGTANPSVVAAWTQGRLVFRSTPLGDAIAEANRYGSTRLVIADPQLDQIRVSGEFRIGETQALVHALEGAFPIRAESDPNGDTIRLYHR